MNKVFLSGYLIRDPEVRYTPSGKAVSRISISVRRRTSKTGANGYPESDIFNLAAWEKTAEFCGRYLTKGSKILVEGTLRTSNYEAKDGTKRYSTEIWIDNIEFAGGSGRTDGNSGGRSEQKNNSQSDGNGFGDEFSGESVSDDDMPF